MAINQWVFFAAVSVRSSRSFHGVRRQEIHRERGQPVLARIIAAGHVLKCRPRRAGSRKRRARHVPVLPGGSAAAILFMHHARLRFNPSRCTSCGSVRSVTVAGVNRAFGSLRGSSRQELSEPRLEFSGRQHAPHQVGLDQARREEICPAGLPSRRDVRIRAEVARARSSTSARSRLSPTARGVVVREGKPERGVGMHARSNRVRLLGEKVEIARHDHVGERPEVVRPGPGIGVVPAVKLFRELEQPRPAVGSLERLALLSTEIVGLGFQILGREMGGQNGADLGSLGQVRKKLEQRAPASSGRARTSASRSSRRTRDEAPWAPPRRTDRP